MRPSPATANAPHAGLCGFILTPVNVVMQAIAQRMLRDDAAAGSMTVTAIEEVIAHQAPPES